MFHFPAIWLPLKSTVIHNAAADLSHKCSLDRSKRLVLWSPDAPLKDSPNPKTRGAVIELPLNRHRVPVLAVLLDTIDARLGVLDRVVEVLHGVGFLLRAQAAQLPSWNQTCYAILDISRCELGSDCVPNNCDV